MKAVCYKCSYVGLDAAATHCPVCRFPFILEAGGEDLAPNIEGIFDRTSVRVGAPPLPGVDNTPRKAVLLMEARKRRIEQKRAKTDAERERARRRSRVTVGFACVSALVAGIAAAFLVTGGL